MHIPHIRLLPSMIWSESLYTDNDNADDDDGAQPDYINSVGHLTKSFNKPEETNEIRIITLREPSLCW